MKSIPFLFLILSLFTYSQQKITGTVYDIDENSILGATVFVKNTTNVTTTDFNGNYSITVIKGDILIFRSRGFIDSFKVVKNNSIINAYLKPQSNNLRYKSCWSQRLVEPPIDFKTPLEFLKIEKLIQQRKDIDKPNLSKSISNRTISFDGILISEQEFKSIDIINLNRSFELKNELIKHPTDHITARLSINTNESAFYNIWFLERKKRLQE